LSLAMLPVVQLLLERALAQVKGHG
jgi:hypothetical protein